MRGGEVARVSFDLWTRGLTWDDDYLYVGLSVHRLEAPGRLAAVAVIDRRDLLEVERVELPCREIYDLTFVPAHLISGTGNGVSYECDASWRRRSARTVSRGWDRA